MCLAHDFHILVFEFRAVPMLSLHAERGADGPRFDRYIDLDCVLLIVIMLTSIFTRNNIIQMK